ncbi:hypothetical protein J6590_031101 [Homalodisca vitripennis]|nr:hypothetical protein J6590_031101 [Homalodisca vitripennis]
MPQTALKKIDPVQNGEVRAKKPSLTLNLGTNGLKVTSEPPPMAGQAGRLQGQDRSAVTCPSSSHARRWYSFSTKEFVVLLVVLQLHHAHHVSLNKVRVSPRVTKQVASHTPYRLTRYESRHVSCNQGTSHTKCLLNKVRVTKYRVTRYESCHVSCNKGTSHAMCNKNVRVTPSITKQVASHTPYRVTRYESRHVSCNQGTSHTKCHLTKYESHHVSRNKLRVTPRIAYQGTSHVTFRVTKARVTLRKGSSLCMMLLLWTVISLATMMRWCAARAISEASAQYFKSVYDVSALDCDKLGNNDEVVPLLNISSLCMMLLLWTVISLATMMRWFAARAISEASAQYFKSVYDASALDCDKLGNNDEASAQYFKSVYDVSALDCDKLGNNDEVVPLLNISSLCMMLLLLTVISLATMMRWCAARAISEASAQYFKSVYDASALDCDKLGNNDEPLLNISSLCMMLLLLTVISGNNDEVMCSACDIRSLCSIFQVSTMMRWCAARAISEASAQYFKSVYDASALDCDKLGNNDESVYDASALDCDKLGNNDEVMCSACDIRSLCSIFQRVRYPKPLLNISSLRMMLLLLTVISLATMMRWCAARAISEASAQYFKSVYDASALDCDKLGNNDEPLLNISSLCMMLLLLTVISLATMMRWCAARAIFEGSAQYFKSVYDASACDWKLSNVISKIIENFPFYALQHNCLNQCSVLTVSLNFLASVWSLRSVYYLLYYCDDVYHGLLYDVNILSSSLTSHQIL